MKNAIVCFVSLILIAGCATKPPPTPPHRGIAFKALEIESAVCDTERAYPLLCGVVDSAVDRIRASGCDPRSVKALRIIAKTIKAKGFRLKDGPMDILTFAKSLEAKQLDCSDFAFIYLEVSERCGMGLKAMYAPDHIFVALPLPGREICWETVYGKESPRAKYEARIVNPIALADGAYLVDREPETALSNAYLEAGLLARKEHMYAYADCLLSQCVRWYPQDVNGWTANATQAILEHDYVSAERFAEEACRLDPGYAGPYHCLGYIYLQRGEDDKAEQYLEEAAMLDPDDQVALRESLMLSLSRLGKNE